MPVETTREIARCENFEVGVNDHGHVCMFGAFAYDGGGQGFGYAIDAEFIRRFLRAFNVERVQQVNRRHCWVTHTGCKILRVDPMLPDEGEAFDIEKWAAEKK